MHTTPPPRIVQSQTSSPLGDVLLAATHQGLVGTWFAHGQEHMPDTSRWPTDEEHPILLSAAAQLHAYFSGKRQSFSLPLQHAWGTLFQRTVWQALLRIPYAQTWTYGDIAQYIGNPKAARAVGAAIGHNPHSIIVPCHRVLGAKGSLTGFSGGLDRKQHLLALEAAHA